MKTWQVMFGGIGSPEIVCSSTPGTALTKLAKSKGFSSWKEMCYDSGYHSAYRIVPINRIFVWESKDSYR